MNRTLLSLPVLALACSLGCGDDARSDAADAAPDAPPAGPGIVFFEHVIAVDVTPDGATAVLEGLTQTAATVYFVDTATGVATAQTEVGDPSRDLATAISNDRRLTALHGDPVQAGVWEATAGWRDLGSPHPAGCDADLSGAWDVSADGAVVVGLAWDGCHPDAFRWTAAGGFTALQRIGTGINGTPSNRATVVSDDGRVAAGFAENAPLDRSPAIWNADGTGVLLDPDNHDIPGEILSISADGTTAAGLTGDDGFVWTAAAGKVPLVRFDVALPTDRVFPNAMSADGALIFGGVGDAFFGTPIAFVWSAGAGMRPLADVAAAAGVELPAGYLLNNVLGASSDGSVLAGVAMDADGNSRTFVLRLPRSAF